MMPLFLIRKATPNDANAMAKVRIDTWRSAYKGIVPDDYLSGLSSEQTATRWRELYFENPQPGVFSFVAENDSKEIVGKKEKQRGTKLIPEIAYGWRNIQALAGSLEQSQTVKF